MCLANGLTCTDACKCKDCNNNKQDEKNDCDDSVKEEEEENVYYDSDYSNDFRIRIYLINSFNF